jgi:hypothetical protein
MITATQAVNAASALYELKNFIGLSQRKSLRELLKGEEGEFFATLIVELAKRVRTMPKVYEQEGLGENAIVYLHYFTGSCDWHITERDTTEEQHQAFGKADLGYGSELGYISIQEMLAFRGFPNVELDLYWTPKPIKDC